MSRPIVDRVQSVGTHGGVTVAACLQHVAEALKPMAVLATEWGLMKLICCMQQGATLLRHKLLVGQRGGNRLTRDQSNRN